MRRFIEQTTLSHQQIAARTGVSKHSVMRWARDGGWQRHPLAPIASEKVPGARAGRRLKLRVLRDKLQALAERCVTELWNSPTVDLDRLLQAMQVVKMARLETMGMVGCTLSGLPPIAFTSVVISSSELTRGAWSSNL
ncbi:MAG: hypothetical protein EON84_04430 [Bradyrhizobiaceae bacterium]|nr:MAG: hypothetical protein EON84_04430 [Bradyrhizobiaceae bacterium]